MKLPKTSRFFLIIITLLTLLAYSNSFESSFQYDDAHVIINNPAVKNPANIGEFFINPQLGSGIIKEMGSYRPLLMATFALNYSLGGLDVFGYHLVNFLLHVLCAWLVFSITCIFMSLPPYGEETNSTPRNLTALLAALLFALHPLQTESVTYITGRSSTLCALFILGSLWGYVRYSLSQKTPYLFLSSFSFLCALLAKETAVTLLLALLIYNFFFPLSRTWKQRLLSLFPHLVLSGAYLLLRMHLLASLPYNARSVRPFYDNLLTQPTAWVHYLRSLVFPVNLSVDYDFPIARSILDHQVLLSIGILVALALIIWKISRHHPATGFFACWFGINLGPTNTLIPLEDVITDRWMYLPLAGYAVLAAMAAEWVFRSRVKNSSRAAKVLFFFFCVLAVELYGFSTTLRNFLWTTDWALWEDAVAKSPNKPRPHIGLGLALMGVGKMDEAITEFQKSIQLDQTDGRAYTNLGYAFFIQNRVEKAIPLFKKGMEVSPRVSPESHNNLAMCYKRLGDMETAIQELQLALSARPLYSSPHYNLGQIYEEKGEIDKAIWHMEKTVQIMPESFNAYKALTRLYEKKGWKEKSQKAFKDSVKYAPFMKITTKQVLF